MDSHDYDNRAAVEDWEAYFTRWRQRSEIVRGRAGATLDLSYGPHPRERIDWFPANAPRCTVAVIHGGYWQWGHKDEFTFLAEPWLDTGAADVAVLGYPLAPDASLPQIMESVERGVAFLEKKSQGELVLIGWSAGGQLAAHVGSKVDKIVCLSGIYDLRPLLATPINDPLELAPEVAATCSPLLNPPSVDCLIGIGAEERVALRQQAAVYFEALQTKGSPALFREWAGLHHYSILDECASAHGAVFKDITEFLFS